MPLREAALQAKALLTFKRAASSSKRWLPVLTLERKQQRKTAERCLQHCRQKVARGRGLAKGLYIVNGKKIVIK
jgi:hypothetical protein